MIDTSKIDPEKLKQHILKSELIATEKLYLEMLIDFKECVTAMLSGLTAGYQHREKELQLKYADSWISVHSRLPAVYVLNDYRSDYVLFVYDNEIHMGIYDYRADEWYSESAQCRIRKDSILYWMPLPEPPEQENQNHE